LLFFFESDYSFVLKKFKNVLYFQIIPLADANVIPPANALPQKSKGMHAKLRTFIKKPKGKDQKKREQDAKNSKEPEVGDYIF
jgi:hypothetical protein